MLKLDSVSINPDSITFNGISIDKLFYNDIQVWPVTPPTPSGEVEAVIGDYFNGVVTFDVDVDESINQYANSLQFRDNATNKTYIIQYITQGTSNYAHCHMAEYVGLIPVEGTEITIEDNIPISFRGKKTYNIRDFISLSDCLEITSYRYDPTGAFWNWYNLHVYVKPCIYAQPSNVIYYTSTDGKIVKPHNAGAIGVLVSNTYDDGVGIWEFENGIEEIGDWALDGLPTLKSINIPKDIKRIGKNALADNRNLTSITFDEGSYLTTIENSAFDGCSGLTDVDLSNCASLTKIGNYAFTQCANLEKITLPRSLSEIGSNCFNSCSNLMLIYYLGYQSEFNAITKGNYWHYLVPNTCVIQMLDFNTTISVY